MLCSTKCHVSWHHDLKPELRHNVVVILQTSANSSVFSPRDVMKILFSRKKILWDSLDAPKSEEKVRIGSELVFLVISNIRSLTVWTLLWQLLSGGPRNQALPGFALILHGHRLRSNIGKFLTILEKHFSDALHSNKVGNVPRGKQLNQSSWHLTTLELTGKYTASKMKLSRLSNSRVDV